MRRHIIDENCRRGQVALVRAKLRSVAQVGVDWGEKGWKDREQIIPHMHGSGATFHTQDAGLFDRRLCHADYCLVFYDVPPAELARWILRLLRNRRFNTHAKRLGKVVKVSDSKIRFWELHASGATEITWSRRKRK